MKEDGECLLNRTMVFFSNNLGNALPRRRPTTCLRLDPPAAALQPLRHMLQRLGIEADKLGSSTGTLTGIESVA